MEVYSETSGGGMLKKLSLAVLLLLFLSTVPQFALSQEEPQVTVEVNPNLELFAVVYILAFNGSDPFIIAPRDYVQDVLTYFAPYKEHEAVKYIREVLDESLPYYSRDSAMMDLGGRLALLDYLPNETNLGDLKPLAEFASESNFMEFYKAHREDYLKYTSSIVPYLENVPELHRKFFGFTYLQLESTHMQYSEKREHTVLDMLFRVNTRHKCSSRLSQYSTSLHIHSLLTFLEKIMSFSKTKAITWTRSEARCQ